MSRSSHLIIRKTGYPSAFPSVQFPVGEKKGIFLFATTSKPALGPTHPSIQWVPGILFRC